MRYDMARYIREQEAEDRFEEFMNEVYGSVKIGGYTYDTAWALREVDPIAYREEYLAWLDSEGLTTEESEADDDDSDE
jgi:hypothetical protein